MIPAAFDYVRAGSVEDAVSHLRKGGEDAKLIAGGHSLLPLMKLRLAAPSLLIDIGRLTGDMSYVKQDGDHIRIGALTRHHDLGHNHVLTTELPLLSHVAGQIGDPQVRHKGTIGGSIAHGDPASDLPAACLALDATFGVVGPSGKRSVPAAKFFKGFLETALEPDEILTEIVVPKARGAGWSFQKFNRRAQDWAIVGVAAVHGVDGKGTGIGLINMSSVPVRARRVEEALAGGSSVAEAAAHAADGLEPPEDLNASGDYRRHLAQVLVRRALQAASHNRAH